MVVEYLEIEQEVTKRGNANVYSGKVDKSLLEKLDRRVILYNHQGGVTGSQVLQVSGNKADIDAVVNSDPSIQRFDESGVQLRGLEIKSDATPTNAEVGELHSRLKGKIGLDIAQHNCKQSGKPWTQHLRDNPDIGVGYWLCKHPNHANPERVPVGEECSLGHSELNEYAQLHIRPFDVTRWL